MISNMVGICIFAYGSLLDLVLWYGGPMKCVYNKTMLYFIYVDLDVG